MLTILLHSLRGRLALLTLAVALPAAIILLSATFWLRNNAIAKNEQHVLSQARLLAAQHQEHVDEVRRLLAALGEVPAATLLAKPGCQAAIDHIYRLGSPFVGQLFVIDAGGEIRCTDRSESPGLNVADRPYFKNALSTSGFAGGDHVTSRFSGEPVMVFTQTLRPMGQPLILASALKLSWFRAHPQFAELPPGSSYAIIDPAGTILMRHPDSDQLTGHSMAGHAPWQIIAQLTGSGVFRATWIDGREHLFGHVPLGPADAPYARLIVRVPMQAIVAESERLFGYGLFALSLAVLLGLIGGWLGGSRLVLRPLQPVFDTVRRVAAGDLTARTGVAAGSGNELRQLAAAVDDMAVVLARERHERQRADKNTRSARDRAQSYLDIVPVMVLALDKYGRIALVNRRTCQLLGCGDEGCCVGNDWFDHIPAEQRATTRAVFRQLMAGEIDPAEYYENEVLASSGERRLIAWRNTVLRDGDGRIVGTLSAGEDITERRRAEDDLRATQQMLQLVTDTVPYHFFWKDRESRYLGCNAVFARDAGVAGSRDIVGKVDQELSWHEQADLYRQDDASVMASGRARLAYIEPQTTADGQRIWLETSKVPLRSAAGEIFGVLGLYHDVTSRIEQQEERARLQAQLQQAHKMEALGQLTGGIAHDFNNILASILGFSRLVHRSLERDEMPGENVARMREVIAAGERAQQLIAKMLTFSRARQEQEARPVALAPIVRETLQMLASSIPACIRVDGHLEDDLPMVAITPVDLQQILINLVVNARDAIPGRGRMTIGLTRLRADKQVCAGCRQSISGDYVALSVADTGHGIPADILPRIFDPFFTTKDIGKGTGMGLAVVHGLIFQSGRHILVDSQVGNGTVFQVLFPPAVAAAGSPEPPAMDFVI